MAGKKPRQGTTRIHWPILFFPFSLVLLPLALQLAAGQQVHRNGFEVRETVWHKGAADAPMREAIHAVTDQTAHSGQSSEQLQLTAENGSFIHYYYPTGRAPISDELTASLWVKANRPGVQIGARVVLPRERNPNNLDEPLTTVIRSDTYQLVGRWQRLELRRPVKLAREQQQLMRFELKRDVDFADAYIDRLVLNVYSGPGLTEVWIDDLEVGPVQVAPPTGTSTRPDAGPGGPGAAPGSPTSQARPRLPGRAAVVELSQDHLMVSGRRFLMRGIRHANVPLKTLRDAGFNTLWLEYATPRPALEEAVNMGFWLVPAMPITQSDPRLLTSDAVSREVTRFLEGDAVLFWDLGGGLATEQERLIGQAAQAVRNADPQRPIGADVWDGFLPYSRHLDLIGVHRWPLMTGMELSQYRDWLNQRRLLSRPGAFLWTWIQTHVPEWYAQVMLEQSGSATGLEAMGPQPEQIRLLTYTALAGGCKGVSFWADKYLGDTQQGRARLLAMALLNQELLLLEPLLLSAVDAPQWIPTSVPEVTAAVLRTERGILVLPIWMGRGAQFVPGQAAVSRLTLVVPQVPVGTQAWEVSPAEVRSLPTERIAGGTRLTLPEFGLTSAIVFTSDNSPTGLLVRFQDQTRRMRKLAAQWAYDLAYTEMERILQIEDQLEKAGHTLPDAQALQDNARQRLRTSWEHSEQNDSRQAYAEAQRALRPLRILMRAQWLEAVRGLSTPVASPYAVSFFTLPRHWQLMNEIRQSTAGPNRLPEGDFEVGATRPMEGWTPQEITLDDVLLKAQRVGEEPRQGEQCLKLEVRPRNPLVTPAALERTFLAINTPVVSMVPGTLVQVSGWIRIPQAIAASGDGAMLYDSAGGEPLAVRLTEPTGWKKFTLYRRVPPSGRIHVTLALTGIGTAYFDDIRIEPLMPGSTVLRPVGPQARR